MALDKPSLNDFLPNGFETQNKTDYKASFSADKIAVGFEKDTLEVLSGPNLNDLLDKTGKNTHVLSDFLNYFKNMPIGSFPVVNTSNQLDYKSVNSFFRNVGELVYSLIPLEDENLRLLDGSSLENEIKTSRFISYIAGLRSTLPNLFTTEANWQAQVQQYGVCGKFVYNTTNRSLRLPKITGFVQGTNDSNSLGDLVEASIPQHTHNGTTESGGGSHDHGRGTMDITGSFNANQLWDGSPYGNGAFGTGGAEVRNTPGTGGDSSQNGFNFKASRSWTGRTTSENIEHTHDFTTDIANNNVYKSGATTVQPQAIKAFIYIVVSIDEAEKQVLSAVYNYKGSVPTYADLPNDAAIGEVYNVIGQDPEGYSGANFAWTGEEWDRLGGTVNLTGYLTKVEAGNTYATKASLESNVDDLQEQINTNASNIANIASQEVIEQGIKKIEALKFSSTIGHGVTNDVDLYSVIYNYAHSSFDLSKFTVVGSPDITDDGIASGFSTNNRIACGFQVKDLANTSWEIYSPIITDIHARGFQFDPIVLNYTNYGADGAIRIDDGGKRIGMYINTVADTDPETRQNNRLNTTTNLASIPVKLQTKMVFDIAAGTYKGYYNTFDGNGWQQIGSTLSPTTTNKQLYDIVYPPSNNVPVRVKENASSTETTIKADLKYITIISNGVEVFSGNKTGIDTIKPDDYNAGSYGTPVVSPDGVLTGGNVTYTITPPTSKLRYEGETYIGSNYTSTSAAVLILVAGVSVTINYNARNIGLSGGAYWVGRGSFDYNKTYAYIVETDGTSVDFYWGLKGSTLTKYTYTPETAYTFTGLVSIGQSLGINSGNIDLNSVKIHVDGNLVYQPCLKIPYTLSNTDLKITRNMDRAIDMANQCGYSQYFGIDEQNGLCLVPQGDNITGRRDLVHREEDSTTHYVIERYSDLYCKQQGTCTANTPVVFAQPYKDDYPKISVPYSAKSKTGFTPTVSGDWTAEGYTYLT